MICDDGSSDARGENDGGQNGNDNPPPNLNRLFLRVLFSLHDRSLQPESSAGPRGACHCALGPTPLRDFSLDPMLDRKMDRNPRSIIIPSTYSSRDANAAVHLKFLKAYRRAEPRYQLPGVRDSFVVADGQVREVRKGHLDQYPGATVGKAGTINLQVP